MALDWFRNWTQRVHRELKIRAYIYLRDRAMERDDIDWVRRNIPNSERMSNDKVHLIFHKVRVECRNIPEAKREQSRLWIDAYRKRKEQENAGTL